MGTYYSAGSVETAMRSHIAQGLDLLKAGQGLEAYNHFLSFGSAVLSRLDVTLGTVFAIEQLRDAKDVVTAAATVAGYSHPTQSGDRTYAVLGGWHTGDFTTDFSDTARYRPELVEQFHQEAGTIAAEEWVHMLQHHTGGPVAGQENVEVDVAAYMDAEGVALSADFLTRYPARAAWFASQHPERRAELQEFAQAFGRYAMTGTVQSA